MSSLPSGTVTFLFTDIEGSTKLAQEHPDMWESLRERHHSILRGAIESNHGYILQIIGDAFCAAFHTVVDGLNAAVEAQRGLQNEEWGESIIKVRMGLHTGSAELHGNDYRGYLTMAKVQRVMSVAYGGQVLLSNTSSELLHSELPTGITLRDMKEHRLKGLPDPERLWQVVAPDLQQDFPPLSSLSEIPNNLPLQLTTFIGREKEINQIKKRLEKNRLVTLAGSGGVGKTRLSIQVASELLQAYPNGVWLVELAPLTDPALVTQVVCSALDIPLQGNTSALNALMDYLRSKKILLVFDNCEHLLDACTQLAETLLKSCPDLRILASSREALGIDGESAYRVPSLSLADPNCGLEIIKQSEAVQLFVERANAVLLGYALTEVNAPTIARICRRLDGIALAIELAASRVKLLKVEQIAARLDDAFRLLTGGSRTALPRQQTLRGTIDWSYNLLSEEEQTMLRRLSVFIGGWSLEAAEAVCNHPNTLDLLTHLVDKSLVVVDRERSHEARYYLLETIRQYAREKLFESSEMQAIRQRHLIHFLAFAETKGTETRGANQVAALQQLDEEYENIREAMDWAIETGQVEEATQTSLALAWLYWWSRGLDQEAYEKITRILNHPATTKEKLFRAAALTIAAFYAPAMVWNTKQGQAMIEEAIEISKLAGEEGKSYLATAYQVWAFCMTMTGGDMAVAEKALNMGIGVARDINDKYTLANLIEWQGLLARVQREYSRAQEFSNEAIRLFRELGSYWGVARASRNIGLVFYAQADYHGAQKYLEEALAIYRTLADRPNLIGVLGDLGKISALNAKYPQAEELFHERLRLAEDRGWTQDIGRCTRDLAYLNLYQGNPASALALFRESLPLVENSDEAEIYLNIVGIASAIFQLSPQNAEYAAQLLGWVQLVMDGIGIDDLSYEKEQIAKTLNAAPAYLGEADYQKFALQGKAMRLEDAIALAKQIAYG